MSEQAEMMGLASGQMYRTPGGVVREIMVVHPGGRRLRIEWRTPPTGKNRPALARTFFHWIRTSQATLAPPTPDPRDAVVAAARKMSDSIAFATGCSITDAKSADEASGRPPHRPLRPRPCGRWAMSRIEWEDAPSRDTFNSVPSCPHCHEDIDVADLRPDCDDEQVIDCPSCCKTFLIQWHYEVTYSTFKPKETP